MWIDVTRHGFLIPCPEHEVKSGLQTDLVLATGKSGSRMTVGISWELW